MSFQRNWRHFTDISLPRGKQRPHLFCQQFLSVYAMLSHYLICGEFYINHKEKNESIMLLRVDTALLIFPALYQHWIKPPTIPVRLKQRVLPFHLGKEADRSNQGPSAVWGVRVRASTEGRTACGIINSIPSTLKPSTLHSSYHLQRTVLKLRRPTVWGSMENVFSSQISINQHTLIFFNYLHRADLILRSLCDLKNVSPICQTCIIYEDPFTQGL